MATGLVLVAAEHTLTYMQAKRYSPSLQQRVPVHVCVCLRTVGTHRARPASTSTPAFIDIDIRTTSHDSGPELNTRVAVRFLTKLQLPLVENTRRNATHPRIHLSAAVARWRRSTMTALASEDD